MGQAARKQKRMKTQEEMGKRWLKRLENAVRKAMELRQSMDDAEAEFMYYLMDLEANPPIWLCGTFPTFLDLLEKFNICCPKRYERFRRTAKVIPMPTVKQIGVHGALEAFKVKNKQQRSALVIVLDKFRKDNDTVASKRTAAKYRKQLTGEPTVPAPLRHYGKEVELKKEIAQLKSVIKDFRRDLRAERKENVRLKKENTSLQQKLQRCQKSKGKKKK